MLKNINKVALLFSVFLLYLLGGLIIGEYHPFSSFPMYNNFPNWSYVFYYVDENNMLIPCNKLKINGGNLGHLYATIAEYNKIPTGNGTETPEQLKLIGNQITQQILNQNGEPIPYKKIKLVRIYYHFSNNQIVSERTYMYEKSLE